MKHHLSWLITALLAFMTIGGTMAAQGTPIPATDSTLATLGYPELRIVVTDAGSDVPKQVTAGRILITLDNQSSDVTDVNILKLPKGVTLDDLNALMTSEGGEAPAWLADLDSAGGFNVAAGNTGYGVIDLSAGDWYIGVGDFNPYSLLTVSGDATLQAEDPPSDLDLDVHEFTLGLPEKLPAGLQVWHVANTGEQSHEIMLVRTPDLLTVEQVLTVMSLPAGATPVEGMPDMSTFEFVAEGSKTMSPGHEIWIEMNLGPGNYVAVCSTPDPETGLPHAALGEIHIFTAEVS